MNKIRKKIRKYHWKLIRYAKNYGLELKLKLNIPSAFITGSIGKTTTCRMLAAILRHAKLKVALSTSQGTFINDTIIRHGDSSNCKYASYLLLDKSVQACVFELARGGLIDQGVVFKSCDVSAVLNIHDNHLGLNGISTRREMAEVKGLVAFAAKKLVALNADDRLVLGLASRVNAENICLISMYQDNPHLKNHMLNNGYVAFLDETSSPKIKFYKGLTLIGEIKSSDIPATLDGLFRPAMHNAMFAIALAWGLGIKFEVIHEALSQFVSNNETNPGRMNFFNHLPFRLLITFADGPEAMQALSEYIRKKTTDGKKILVISASGDRLDSFLYNTGKVAAADFDHFICTEYDNLRGRNALEAASLVVNGLLEHEVDQERITVVASQTEAIKTAFSMARPGDFLVIESYYGLKAKEFGLLDYPL